MKYTMEDPYIHKLSQVGRLIEEWRKYGRLIVAYDFDNTIFDYHGKGHTYPQVIKQLKQLGHMGCYMICFTASDPSRFKEISQQLAKDGIPCHGINVDSDIIPFKGRKIYYNVMYDDRTGLGEVVGVMSAVISTILTEQIKLIDKLNPDVSKENLKDRIEGRACAFSGEPFKVGEWFYNNNTPAAFSQYMPPDLDIIPSVESLMQLFKR